MEITSILVENWYIFVGILCLVGMIAYFVYKFLGLPTKTQRSKIKEWLLYAVTMAEKELGSGTGEIKLRYVYDLFIARFPLVARVMSFSTFETWVSIAIEEMENLLESNDSIKKLVEGE